jgi:THUMP domain-like
MAATANNIDRLAREVGVEASRWAFTQWALRERAKSKFSKAEEMLFDRDGLEMASHEDLAKGIHASGFPLGARAADLTVGIGADLIGLSDGRDAVGFETDPARAEMARHNLMVYGRTAEIRVQDCLGAEWDFEYAFADPARRSKGRRTLDPAQFTPRLDELVPRLALLKLGRIKLSPMLADDFLGSLSPNRVFVSHERECKEVLVHVGRDCGKDKNTQGVWALIAGQGTWLPGEVPLAETLADPLAFVYEADPAVIRAHALGNCGMPGLGDSNGYLTYPEVLRPSGFGRGYQVLWSGPYRMKEVQEALRVVGGKVEVVKVRGVEIDVIRVRKQFAASGEKTLTLMLYPVAKVVRAILTEPAGSP